MTLRLKRESALNLTLEGSVGCFSVGTGRPGQNSLEVKYFLTHASLYFASGPNEAVLSHLAPVREIFDFEQLDFDEIMQRDIDDARVSSELIPYLLDAKSADLIKLFPPIVVVVLPVKEHENRPADLYPQVEEITNPEKDDQPGEYILRAGSVGQEVFQFEQPISSGELLQHDLVRFKLNTHKTRLVIVDGQHRAMALLALYRNLKDQWSDEKRAPFKEYYAEWTPKYIQEFELREINLPVMLCTFPQLCENYQGDSDLKKAARAIFLTLNKTARKVSNSRNILLDDNDLIALFLRRCLSKVKRKDVLSPYSFRIFNVELDQFEDRLKIQSRIAITSVNHVHYFIEHLIFNKGDEDVNGAKPRSGKFFKRKDLNVFGAMDRLNGRNLLGAEIADVTTRDTFTAESAEKLGESFDERYGHFIISLFEKFEAYEYHNRSILALETRLGIHEDRKLKPILFEGQGIGRVFEAHRENLKQKLKENIFRTDVPKIEELKRRLDDTASRIERALAGFRIDRAGRYLQKVSDKGKLRLGDGAWHPKIVKFFDDIYDNVFTTVAFQTALICTFFSEVERAERAIRKTGGSCLDVDESFDEYLAQLNSFFIPESSSQFRKIIRLFAGELEGDITDWKIVLSPQTFRSVVYRGEMQPDQWPKYKYLILEIWRPSNMDLAQSIGSERVKCRKQIFISLYEEYRGTFAREQMKHEDALDSDERQKIFNDTFTAFTGFLKIIGVSADLPKKRELHSALEGGSEDAGAKEIEAELWDSVEIE